MNAKDWKGKKVIVSGRIPGGRSVLIDRLTDAGAIIGARVSKRTAMFIKGAAPGARYDQAKTLGVPIATPKQAEAMLNGEEVDLSAPASQVSNAPDTNTTLSKLRDLLHAEPSRDGWRAVCEALSRCDPGTLSVALDYIQQSSEPWGGALSSFETRWPLTNTSARWMNPHYHHLHLHRTGTQYNQVTEDDLTNLPRLDIRFMPRAWQRMLLQAETSPIFQVARVLGFYKVKVSTTTARNIIHSPDLINLRALYLTSRPLSTKFARDFAKATSLPNLTHLDISGSRFFEEGARAITTSPNFAALQHLNLASLEISDLSDWELPPTLRSLNLGHNIMTWGSRAMAQFKVTGATLATLPNLRALCLANNNLTDRYLNALIEADAFARLEHLNLSTNPELGHTSADLLCEALPDLPDLKHLHAVQAGVTGRARKRLKRACEARGVTLHV